MNDQHDPDVQEIIDLGIPAPLRPSTPDEQVQYERDMAVEARRGGRALTGRLAKLVAEADHYWPDMVQALQGKAVYRETGEPILAPDKWAVDPVRGVWETHVASREFARTLAGPPDPYFGPTYLRRPQVVTLAAAMAMTTWPIIAAAYGVLPDPGYPAPLTDSEGNPFNTPAVQRGIEQYQAEGR